MHANMCGQRSAVILILCNFCHIVFLNPKDDAATTGKQTFPSGNGKIFSRTTNLSVTDICLLLNTCDYSKNVQIPNCYCDDHCHIYDDCCIDHQSTIQMDVKEFHRDREREKCHQVFGRDIGVFVVPDCPHSPQPSDITNGFWRNVPVTGYSSTVYKNMGIASCYHEKEYFVWTIVFILQYCNDVIEIGSLRNMSEYDRANYYHGQDCDHYLMPPIGKDPRFCIPFVHNESECLGDRIPIVSSKGPYRNKRCCKRFEERCSNACVGAGISPLEAIQLRTGKSMTAIFQFSSDGPIKKEGFDLPLRKPHIKVSLSNINIERILIVKPAAQNKDIEWQRLLTVYEMCFKKVLRNDHLTIRYNSPFMFIQQEDVFGGFVSVDYTVYIPQEFRSHEELLETLQWIDGHTIYYTEEYDNEMVEVELETKLRTDEDYLLCESPNFTCIYINHFDNPYEDGNGIIKKLSEYADFPDKSCKGILFRTYLFKTESSVTISCEKSSNFKITLVKTDFYTSLLLYILLCISMLSLVFIIYLHRRNSLSKTIVGLIFQIIVFAIFTNQIITTFSNLYPNGMIRNLLRLLSQILIMTAISLKLYSSMLLILFMAFIKGQGNTEMLRCKILHIVLLALTTVISVILVISVRQFFPDQNQLVGCRDTFLAWENASYVLIVTIFILLAVLCSSLFVYLRKRKKSKLLQSCIFYLSANGLVWCLNLACLVVKYFNEHLDLYPSTLIFFTLFSIQIPLIFLSCLMCHCTTSCENFAIDHNMPN